MTKRAVSGFLGVRRNSGGAGLLWEARWTARDGRAMSRTGFASAEAAARFYDEQALADDANACVVAPCHFFRGAARLYTRVALAGATLAAPFSRPARPCSRTNFDERGEKNEVVRAPVSLPRRINLSGCRYYIIRGDALGRFRLLAHAVRARDALEAANGDVARVPADVFGSVTAKNVAERERAAAAQRALRASAGDSGSSGGGGSSGGSGGSGGGGSSSTGAALSVRAPKRQRLGDAAEARAPTSAAQGALLSVLTRSAAAAAAATALRI
jgi:hypothetical protein